MMRCYACGGPVTDEGEAAEPIRRPGELEIVCEFCGQAELPQWWSSFSPYADQLRALGRHADANRGHWEVPDDWEGPPQPEYSERDDEAYDEMVREDV